MFLAGTGPEMYRGMPCNCLTLSYLPVQVCQVVLDRPQGKGNLEQNLSPDGTGQGMCQEKKLQNPKVVHLMGQVCQVALINCLVMAQIVRMSLVQIGNEEGEMMFEDRSLLVFLMDQESLEDRVHNHVKVLVATQMLLDGTGLAMNQDSNSQGQ